MSHEHGGHLAMEFVKGDSLQIAANSDVGLVRKRNEDYYVVEQDHDLVIVCDGMGGHPGGDIASRMAAEEIRSVVLDGVGKDFDYHLEKELPPALEPHAELLKGIFWADRQLREYGNKNPEYHGMGTTVVAIQQKNDTMCVAHVGDSRLYAFDEELEQVTQDHSVVATNPEYANFAGMKNILTRAMGVGDYLEVDFTILPVKKGMQYMLCSDGLTNFVTDSLMAQVLKSDLTAQEKVDRLIEDAKKGGGGDNITLALVRLDSETADDDSILKGSVKQEQRDLRVRVG